MLMPLEVNYSNQPVKIVAPPQQAIFLAGPTPRDPETPSWRPLAIEALKELEYTGLVYVPEVESPDIGYYDYTNQVEWEWEALDRADAIAFWVPRKIDTSKPSLGMPAFTTNVELGLYLGKSPDKVFYGRPDDSEKNRYPDKLYQRYTGRTAINNLGDLMAQVIEGIRK